MTMSAEEFGRRSRLVLLQYGESMKGLAAAMDAASHSFRRWAELVHSECVLHRVTLGWSIEDRRELDRLVRRLHSDRPDLSMTDCILRVGVAMESCGHGE